MIKVTIVGSKLGSVLVVFSMVWHTAHAQQRQVEFEGSALLSEQLLPTQKFVSEGSENIDVDSETLYSIDLETTIHQDQHSVFIWLEHNRNQPADGVSAWLENTNEDAGTTLDGDDTSRTQLSSLYWRYRFAEQQSEVMVGLAEVSMLLDTNEIANDEVGQFLAAGFVNNPSIDFPDYAPAIRYQGTIPKGDWQWRALLSNAKGLADNQGNYADTFAQIDGSEGVFIALEGQKKLANDTLLTLGSWHNSDTKRYGTYGAWYTQRGAFKLHGRLSQSVSYEHTEDNFDSDKSHFASAVAQYQYQDFVFASGLSYLSNQSRDNDSTITRMAECYVQYHWSENLHTTLSHQWHDGVVNTESPLEAAPQLVANWQEVVTLRMVVHW